MRKMSESSDAGEEKKGEGDRSKLIAKLFGKRIKIIKLEFYSFFFRGYIWLIISTR